MGDLYFTVAFSLINIVVPYAIIRRDRARLESAELARAWNAPSFACALYFFGPLSLPAHFWITRRKPTALLQGAAWAAAILAVESTIVSAFERAT